MADFFSDPTLLNTSPIKRAAYSDRTAWLMAEISRLAYEPLPCEISFNSVLEEIKAAIRSGEYENTLEGLLNRFQQQGNAIDSTTTDTLRKANFELLDSFAINGTEALVAKLQPYTGFDGMLVLAFRGTQKTVTDIRTDIKADLIDAPQGGRVHRGFYEAFKQIQAPVTKMINKHPGLPLYITGHSLGGALALIATRYLAPNSIGATYTFGCPRAADDAFFKDIRTPVYRVVNAADGVARVPFGYGSALALNALRVLPLNGTKWISEWLRSRFLGYTHHGSLIFLSAPINELDENGIAYKNLTVEKSPNIFMQGTIVLNRIRTSGFKAIGNDHSIKDYSNKLLAHAKRRNVNQTVPQRAKAIHSKFPKPMRRKTDFITNND